MTTTQPETATLTAFARLAGFKQSYASQLKAAGRLVLTDDGKRVRVMESLERIKTTRDPSKEGVRARHASARGEASQMAPSEQSEPDQTFDLDDAGDEQDGVGYTRFQSARAAREHWNALAAKRDYQVTMGQLLDVNAVRSACADAVTTLRTRIEALPDTLAPQLAPVTDEARLRATLAETFEHTLEELARSFRAVTENSESDK